MAIYPSDTLTTRSGLPLTFTFFGHASLAIEFDGKHYYIDPVSAEAGGAAFDDYAAMPKADFIVVTHPHEDHLDRRVIAKLSKKGTTVACDGSSAKRLGTGLAESIALFKPGNKGQMTGRGQTEVWFEAVPAYNTSPEQLKFHPRRSLFNGYVFTMGGTRIYIAGDTEPTPEMLALRDIDIAFLPVNQPYTMKVDQAVEAVKAIRPKIFYPYHYGQTEFKTDIDRLVRELEGVTEVRIRPME